MFNFSPRFLCLYELFLCQNVLDICCVEFFAVVGLRLKWQSLPSSWSSQPVSIPRRGLQTDTKRVPSITRRNEKSINSLSVEMCS